MCFEVIWLLHTVVINIVITVSIFKNIDCLWILVIKVFFEINWVFEIPKINADKCNACFYRNKNISKRKYSAQTKMECCKAYNIGCKKNDGTSITIVCDWNFMYFINFKFTNDFWTVASACDYRYKDYYGFRSILPYNNYRQFDIFNYQSMRAHSSDLIYSIIQKFQILMLSET